MAPSVSNGEVPTGRSLSTQPHVAGNWKRGGFQLRRPVANCCCIEPEEPISMGNSEENGREVKLNNVSYNGRKHVVLRWTLWTILCLIVFLYIGALILMPTKVGRTLLLYSITLTKSNIWGTAGSFALLFAGPFFLLVFGAVAYLHFFPKSTRSGERRSKGAKASLGTHPLIVSGPLGVVTTAEVIWISGFVLLFSWIMVAYFINDFRTLAEEYPGASTSFMWIKRVKRLGGHLGFVGGICLGLLFIPVSRGSVLLRLIDIPFEHAAKYHVWLGHFTMIVFSLHGLFFLGPWYFEGKLVKLPFGPQVESVPLPVPPLQNAEAVSFFFSTFGITGSNGSTSVFPFAMSIFSGIRLRVFTRKKNDESLNLIRDKDYDC
ncbi:hypothetical protein R1sor_020147 [Riccia sorocarpa]|uniref:Ferric oxidoreductase domain-containing protein n=1 Tax=Riccia sorocarpa TaxID=122646 RepID=A0ABD3IIC4_9MARC